MFVYLQIGLCTQNLVLLHNMIHTPSNNSAMKERLCCILLSPNTSKASLFHPNTSTIKFFRAVDGTLTGKRPPFRLLVCTCWVLLYFTYLWIAQQVCKARRKSLYPHRLLVPSITCFDIYLNSCRLVQHSRTIVCADISCYSPILRDFVWLWGERPQRRPFGGPVLWNERLLLVSGT